MGNEKSVVPVKLSCPVCGATEIREFAVMERVPTLCNVLCATREEALGVPRGDLRLGFCAECGHVYNFSFVPGEIDYATAYENSLLFSEKFRAYATGLASDLIERFGLHGKQIVEIGCGGGEFLQMLCDMGGNIGVGFDPSLSAQRVIDAASERVRFVNDYYSSRYVHTKVDFLCCRHVLEHVEAPLAFLRNVSMGLRGKASCSVFFEVPNVEFMVKDGSVWDFIYEHPSYFSESSLQRLFASAGFEIHRITASFGAQYLCIEGSLEDGNAAGRSRNDRPPEELSGSIELFRDRFDGVIRSWSRILANMEARSEKFVVWGAGSKGVTFLNICDRMGRIRFVTDVNARKHGKYIPGSGQEIVPPDFLREYQPDSIIVMNPIYEAEVRDAVGVLGLQPRILLANQPEVAPDRLG